MKTALSLNFKQIATFTWFCDKHMLLQKLNLLEDVVSILTKQQKRKGSRKKTLFFTETVDDNVEFIEEDEGVPHKTHVNNNLHSIFSNAELYITNHQIYNLNGLYAHRSHISNNFKSTLSDYKGV